jgi:hypothetical protein
MSGKVHYKKGYKYQIVKDYIVNIDIKPEKDIISPYIKLSKEGELTIKNGYAWDGPSGPTIDSKNFMRGSLVHDALYQLMRESFLDKDTYRKKADLIMYEMCKQDGMAYLRAWWVYRGVRAFGDPSADPANKKKVQVAP